jgi:hypothetical protein
MDLPIHEALDIVKTYSSPDTAWSSIVDLCRKSHRRLPWDTLPTPDLERDIAAATGWLTAQLEKLPKVKGVYLGLDTLNMAKGKGHNVEFGGTRECDTSVDDVEWLFDGQLQYGDSHLIRGLYELKTVYESKPWKAGSEFCDYMLFFAYSGIVLSAAFQEVATSRTLLVAWGFHDGDMLALGRKQRRRFSRICA